jgi:hypothetical protein
MNPFNRYISYLYVQAKSFEEKKPVPPMPGRGGMGDMS